MSFWCKYSEEFSTLLKTVLSRFPQPMKWVADRIGISLTTLERAQRNAATFPPLYLVPLYRCTGDRRVLDAVLAPHQIAWFETADLTVDPAGSLPTPAIARRLLALESAVFSLRARCLQLAAGDVPSERGCAVDETGRLGLATMAAVRALEVAAAAAVECRCHQAGADRASPALATAPVVREHGVPYSAATVTLLPVAGRPVSCEHCGAACAVDDPGVTISVLGVYCGQACAVADWRAYRVLKAQRRAAAPVQEVA